MDNEAQTNSATADTSTQQAAPTAPDAAVAADVSPSVAADPALSPQDSAPSGETPTAPETGNADPSEARASTLIAQHFGLDEATAAALPPEIRAKLAAQAESAVFDRFLNQNKPGQNQPGQQPQQQGEASAAAAQIAPAINLDFKPFLDGITAEFGETGAKVFGGALQALVGEINKQLAPMAQMQQAFGPMAQSWAGYAQAQEKQGIDQFFGGLAKQPAWAPHLSGPGGEALKTKATELAYAFANAARQNGQQMTGEQALMTGWLAATKGTSNQQVVQQHQAQIQKRAKQITTPPGTAVAAGKGDKKDNRTTEERMREIVNAKFEEHGLATAAA